MANSNLSDVATNEKVQILLVDGDPAGLLKLRSMLDESHFELVEARSGEEAIFRLEDSDFAVVVLDAWLPGMTGFETARRIRERFADRRIPMIFLSPSDKDFPVAKAYSLGTVDYLVYPVLPEILRAKVRGLAELYAEKRKAQRQAEQLRLLIEGTKDYAIFRLDPVGIVTTWNAGAERIKGYSANEIIGKHFSVFYTEEAVLNAWPQFELKEAVRQGRFEDEGWRVRKDGTQFWANVVISALIDANGVLLGFAKITRDLTERKKAEESLLLAQVELENRVRLRTQELAEANAVLREADRQKDDFLAMLAHELRNPLAPLRNALQIIKMPGLSADAARLAQEMMERQVQHLVRMVDDLLDVSRIMRGKIDLRRERLNLASIFIRAVETAQPTIETQGHELTVSLPPTPIWLEGDLVRLAQVVSNLLVNAAKYTDKAGSIWLTGERVGDEAIIRVKDTGVGIALSLLPQIFELFVQGDQSLARSQGGLGIGLTLVSRLVEMHGGAVVAHSDGPGCGSEFIVRLPAAIFREEDDDGAELQHAVAPSVRRRILVVDDNVDAAESAAMLLQIMGHDVQIAHEGEGALHWARKLRPDVLLLDIGLPGKSGYEVARELRAEPEFNDMIIVAVTGYGQENDRRNAHAAGFDFHLTKPLPPDTLSGIVSSTIRSSPLAPDSSLNP